ncbi:keratinocyte proline-rich protein isoform X1 [Triticum aestivum]|uniref:keratinocyte proline-rich protein isoform X1 n=1 Tax=Triticum aestivum TaxID=4565 RepID=UPI001D020DC4|nr:keratinocyte proline-rich protein-like isoform X1 [Triticum aestivum]
MAKPWLFLGILLSLWIIGRYLPNSWNLKLQRTKPCSLWREPTWNPLLPGYTPLAESVGRKTKKHTEIGQQGVSYLVLPRPSPQPAPRPSPQPTPQPTPRPSPHPSSRPRPSPHPSPQLTPRPSPHLSPRPSPHPSSRPHPLLLQRWVGSFQMSLCLALRAATRGSICL